MSSVSIGEVIEVVKIGFSEKGRTVVRLWMGDDGIRVSVMRFRTMACTAETC